MIHDPDFIMPFGKDAGYNLKQIYKYLPTYLEWLIKYMPEFEIDISQFTCLPSPTPFTKTYVGPEGLRSTKKSDFTVKAALTYVENGGQLKEVNFSFSEETLKILEEKRSGKYIAPSYTYFNERPFEDID